MFLLLEAFFQMPLVGGFRLQFVLVSRIETKPFLRKLPLRSIDAGSAVIAAVSEQQRMKELTS